MELYNLLNDVAAAVETDDHLEAGMDPNWLLTQADHRVILDRAHGEAAESLYYCTLRVTAYRVACEVVTDRYGY